MFGINLKLTARDQEMPASLYYCETLITLLFSSKLETVSEYFFLKIFFGAFIRTGQLRSRQEAGEREGE